MTQTGIIDSVTVDTENDEIQVSVFLGPGRYARRIPFRTPMPGLFVVPERTQEVEVYELEGGGKVAQYPRQSPDSTTRTVPSGMSQGDLSITLNNGTQIDFLKQSDGTYNIDVDADGDINIDAAGNVYIDGIDFDQHTHDFEDSTISDTSDGSGTESTQTKQTDVPQ